MNGKTVHVSSSSGGRDRQTGLVYCCGPTVYDDCHIGHAFSYVRFDLLRRAMQTYCNTDLITCMGVTDIDDKIIDKAIRSKEDWILISRRYFDSFKQDMRDLNCLPIHAYLKVSDHVPHIMQYIQDLESSGAAYVNEETLDVVFNSAAVKSSSPSSPSNPYNLIHHDADRMVGKRSPADFVLWKKRKPNEPFFEYESVSKQSVIEGRPGWHVECSAMIHAAFGPRIDLHFGGADLVFPHHYSESACCAAHSQSHRTADKVTDWCSHWVHSGHLVLDKEKMSKSLGNVISIKEFLKLHSHNIMRIICLRTGSRSDTPFEQELLSGAAHVDVKLKRLAFLLDDGIRLASSGGKQEPDEELERLIPQTEEEILTGIADDMDFNAGLNAMISVYSLLKEKQNVPLVTLVKLKVLLNRWLTATGLVYGSTANASAGSPPSLSSSTDVVQLLNDLHSVRNELREIGVDLVQTKDNRGKQLLRITDDMRSKLSQYGVMAKDPPASSS